jgi:iron complex outermembrane receptor protein
MSFKARSLCGYLWVSSALTLCLSPVARAAGLVPDASQRESVSLDAVVVTADRKNSFGADFVQTGAFRDARVRDTPLTITILPRDLLDAQQARSVFDAVRNTAGVSQAQINTVIYSNLAIRGIQVDNATNFRLNGVLPIFNFVDMPMEDKDRVEVLKGAGGLYYGFATPSGIVNLVTKRPTSEPLTQVELFGDSHGGIGGAVDLSRPLGETAGGRFNLGGSTLETGIDRTTGHRYFASTALDWRPTDKLTVELDGEYVYKTITEPTEFVLPAAVGGVITVPPLQASSKNLGADWMQAKGWEGNLLAKARYDVSPAWSASFSIGQSYMKRDRAYSSFSGYNLASGAGVLGVAMTHGNDYRSTLYRADLAGAFQTGPIEHQVLVGVSRNVRDTNIPTAVRYSFAQNLYNPVVIPQQPNPARIIANPSRVKDNGAFIFDRATYGGWLQATIGYRKADYSDVSRTTSYKAKSGALSYGLMIKPVKWASLYGNYVEGLESGGTAQQIAANAGETLPAALSKQKEFGVKVEPLAGFLLTLAHFDIDRASSYINSANVFVQDGRANYKGFEASASGEVTRDLSISLSAVSLDAKQVSGAASVVGKRIENTAKTSGSVFAEYKIRAIDGLRVSGGLFYVGSRSVNALNQAFVPSYTTLDLGASYQTKVAGQRTTFRVYGENVTGKRYWAATGSGLAAQGAPSAVKFSVSSAF